MAIAALPPDEQIVIRRKIEAAAKSYKSGDAYEFPAMTQNTLAVKP